MSVLDVIQAGLVPYPDALAWQRQLAEDRIAGRLSRDVLLLLEHPPVVTFGRNSQVSHLLQPDGIDVFEVERGGDVALAARARALEVKAAEIEFVKGQDTFIQVTETLGLPE